MMVKRQLPFWGACYGGRVHLIVAAEGGSCFTACNGRVKGRGAVTNPTPEDLKTGLCPQCIKLARDRGLQVPGQVNFHGPDRFEY